MRKFYVYRKMIFMYKIAHNIIEKIGGGKVSTGVNVVAGWCGLNIKSVYDWMKPRKKGGTNGLIPTKYHHIIMSRALNEGIELTPEDFF